MNSVIWVILGVVVLVSLVLAFRGRGHARSAAGMDSSSNPVQRQVKAGTESDPTRSGQGQQGGHKGGCC